MRRPVQTDRGPNRTIAAAGFADALTATLDGRITFDMPDGGLALRLCFCSLNPTELALAILALAIRRAEDGDAVTGLLPDDRGWNAFDHYVYDGRLAAGQRSVDRSEQFADLRYQFAMSTERCGD